MNNEQMELAQQFKLDILKVPAHLKDLYGKNNVSRLEVLEASRDREQWAKDMAFAECGKVYGGYAINERAETILTSEHQKLDKFIEHSLKLKMAQEAFEGPFKARAEQEARRLWVEAHTCPVCQSAEVHNTAAAPCRPCVLVARVQTANTSERQHAVSQWLKNHDVDWASV